MKKGMMGLWCIIVESFDTNCTYWGNGSNWSSIGCIVFIMIDLQFWILESD